MLAGSLERLAQSYPEDNDIAIAVALVRREYDALDDSLEALVGVLTRDPDDERAIVLWSQIKAERGDEDAYERIQGALAKDPEAQALRLQYARLLASLSELPAAREQFEILLENQTQRGCRARDLVGNLAPDKAQRWGSTEQMR